MPFPTTEQATELIGRFAKLEADLKAIDEEARAIISDIRRDGLEVKLRRSSASMQSELSGVGHTARELSRRCRAVWMDVGRQAEFQAMEEYAASKEEARA